MIRSFIRYLRGYVKIRVEGYSPERFLNLCSFHRIYLWGLTPSESGYDMCLSIRDFRRIRPLAKKTHTRIRLTEKHGLPFSAARYRKKKLSAAGFILCILLLKLYSLFIWDIHIEGNEKWTDETLSEFLESCGIKAFMLKRDVDCQGIVKNIRREYNDIVWVSASIAGSRLNIQIKENEDTYPAENKESISSQEGIDLVASCDGVITDIVTRTGIPQVHVGDKVKKGDLLVLGRVDVVDDNGEVTDYHYQHSDADIFADTELEYQNSMPSAYQKKIYNGREKLLLYVRIHDWMFSIGWLDEPAGNCEYYTVEHGLRTGENFYLPVSFGIRKSRMYSVENTPYTETEIREKLTGEFDYFCEELEEKGVQILGNSVTIKMYDDSAVASGTISLNERIAEEKNTDILTVERKETDESVGTEN